MFFDPVFVAPGFFVYLCSGVKGSQHTSASANERSLAPGLDCGFTVAGFFCAVNVGKMTD